MFHLRVYRVRLVMIRGMTPQGSLWPICGPPSHRLCVCHRQGGYQAVRERRRETLAGRGTAASAASPDSPKSASAPHRSKCSREGGAGAALALICLVRAAGLSGIEGMSGLRGMVWIQTPVSYRTQGDGSATVPEAGALQPLAMRASRPAYTCTTGSMVYENPPLRVIGRCLPTSASDVLGSAAGRVGARTFLPRENAR